MDRFQLLFLGGSGLLVLVQSIRGWRQGVVRQLVNLLALVTAYGAAMVSGRLAAPLFHRLGYPDLLVSVIAGAAVGCVVYLALTLAGSVIFRRTNDQSLGLLRLGYGAGGSALGVVGALVTVWLSVMAIRFLGTVAQAEVNMAKTPAARREGMTASPMAVELAQLKHSLDSGPTGALMNGTDPMPQRFYLIIEKMTKVISNVDAMRRFVTYPGTKVLSQNPKIVALQKDPEIARQVGSGNYVGLLGNPKILAAVSDPGLEGLVKSFELEKALDYALGGDGGRKAAGGNAD
jgi:uncharacterized membrane protein required for colicin V production